MRCRAIGSLLAVTVLLAGCGSTSTSNYHASVDAACATHFAQVRAIVADQRSQHLTLAEVTSRIQAAGNQLRAVIQTDVPSADLPGVRTLLGDLQALPAGSNQTLAQARQYEERLKADFARLGLQTCVKDEQAGLASLSS